MTNPCGFDGLSMFVLGQAEPVASDRSEVIPFADLLQESFIHHATDKNKSASWSPGESVSMLRNPMFH
ncbi:MAG: hypothetical protein CMJ77_10785 [Planctomycetaceae bacterium]|nr:hypothetical protein [Planctomycetaceae bacterium]